MHRETINRAGIQMKHAQSAALFLLATLMGLHMVVAASPAVAGIVTQIPSSSAGQPKDFWGFVMTEYYGSYDDTERCWLKVSPISSDENAVCMRPHKLEVVDVEGEKYFFVVTSGKAGDCHACPGKMGLIKLKQGTEFMTLVARNSLEEEFGSWGEVPSEESFHLRLIGPEGGYGWVIETAYTAQGYTESSASIFGVISDRFRRLGTILTGEHDGNDCPHPTTVEASANCTNYSGQILFGRTISALFRSIFVEFDGIQNGKPKNGQLRIDFNDNSLSYDVPSGLRLD